jgi:hypothetical protein
MALFIHVFHSHNERPIAESSGVFMRLWVEIHERNKVGRLSTVTPEYYEPPFTLTTANSSTKLVLMAESPICRLHDCLNDKDGGISLRGCRRSFHQIGSHSTAPGDIFRLLYAAFSALSICASARLDTQNTSLFLKKQAPIPYNIPDTRPVYVNTRLHTLLLITTKQCTLFQHVAYLRCLPMAGGRPQSTGEAHHYARGGNSTVSLNVKVAFGLIALSHTGRGGRWAKKKIVRNVKASRLWSH